MKKNTLILIFLMPLQTLALTPLTTGNINKTSSIESSLHVKGKVTLDDVKVRSETKIDGSLDASNTRFDSLDVKGEVTLADETIIFGKTNINGSLVAYDTYFGDTLVVTGNSIHLNEGSKAKEIVVKNTSEATIYLDSSTVIGNITFEGEKGSVVLENSGKLIGKVNGGKVLKSSLSEKDQKK